MFKYKNDDQLLSELRQRETDVWNALVRGDMQADAAALHQDFLGVYPDGYAGKTDHVSLLENGPTIAEFELSSLKVIPLGEEYAILTYRADFRRKMKTDFETMYVSSIWRRSNESWVNIFSQDTPAVG